MATVTQRWDVPFWDRGVPKTGLSPLITIYDDGGTPVVSGAAMTEVGGGWYFYDHTTADDTEHYYGYVDGGATLKDADRYPLGSNVDEFTVAQTEDNIRGADGDDLKDISDEIAAAQGNITSILADTNEMQGKLPTNNIMGSSDKDDHDTDIDAILADTAAIEPLVSTNLDATVNSRATQAQILSDATPFPGANIDAAISSRAAPGNAMDLVTDAVDANAIATSGAQEIRDEILADSTPFNGANIDAAISSRATQADILSDATPFPGANIDAAITSRPTAAQIDTQLSGTHGAGSWEGSSAAAVADAVWDEPRADHIAAGSFGRSLQIVRGGTAQAGAASSITLDAGASSVTNFYVNTLAFIISGTGAGQVRRITAYNGTTKVATVANAWSTQPNATSIFTILPMAEILSAIRVSGITSTTFAANAITANAIADNAITAAKINAAAITAAKIATDAITADKIAASAIGSSEIAAGAITAGKFAADAIDANALATSAAQEIRDAILADATPFNGASIAAILADTNEMQGKLPTNNIMGSSVKTDKDDEIDAILADTAAMEPLVSANLDAAVSSRPTVAQIDTQLSGTHGGGSWEGATAAAIDAQLSGAHGAGSWEGDSAATIDALLSANHGSGSWEGNEASVITAIVNAIMDEAILSHTTDGTVGEALVLIRGLVQQNFVLDNTSYNVQGLLVSSRIRIYDTKANAELAGVAGLLATFTQTAIAEGGDARLAASYTVVREP